MDSWIVQLVLADKVNSYFDVIQIFELVYDFDINLSSCVILLYEVNFMYAFEAKGKVPFEN